MQGSRPQLLSYRCAFRKHSVGCIARVHRGVGTASTCVFRALRIPYLYSAFSVFFGCIWGFHINSKSERIPDYKSKKGYLEFVLKSQTK